MSISTMNVAVPLAAVFAITVAAPAGDLCDPGRPIQQVPLPDMIGHFGNPLAVAPGLIAVGNPKSSPVWPYPGTVILYRRGIADWTIDATIPVPLDFDTGALGSTTLLRDWLFVPDTTSSRAYHYDAASTPPRWVQVANFRPRSWKVVAASEDQVVLLESGLTVVLDRDSTATTGWRVGSTVPVGVGTTVVISGDLLACRRDQDVCVYRRMGSEWIADGVIEYPTIPGITTFRRPFFSTDGHRIAIGYSNRVAQLEPGWVDVYKKNSLDDGWRLETRIEPVWDSRFTTTAFGRSVSLVGDRLAIGSPNDDFVGLGAGAVYCYRFIDGVWRPSASYGHPSAEENGQFGTCVAIQGDDLIATGAGFGVTLNPVVIPFCADPATTKVCTPGIVALYNFVNMFLAESMGADYTRDGALTLDDLFRFLADWFAGCPA